MKRRYEQTTFLDKLFSLVNDDEIYDASQEYCEQCGRMTKHHVFNHGDWEEHKCKKCGYQKGYRVR